MKLGWRRNYIRQKGYFLNIIRQYKERTDIRVYLEIILSLLTISIFSIFALRPTLLTIAELLQEIKGKEEVLTQMNTKIGNLTSAQLLYDQNRGNINILKSTVPDYPQPDVILRQFEGLSQQNNLTLNNFSLDDAPLKGNPGKVTSKSKKGDTNPANSVLVSANFSTELTNYPSVETLVNSFENLRLPYNINLLFLDTTTKDDSEITLVNMSGYFLYNERSTTK